MTEIREVKRPEGEWVDALKNASFAVGIYPKGHPEEGMHLHAVPTHGTIKRSEIIGCLVEICQALMDGRLTSDVIVND